jgi:hypothetical protein
MLHSRTLKFSDPIVGSSLGASGHSRLIKSKVNVSELVLQQGKEQDSTHLIAILPVMYCSTKLKLALLLWTAVEGAPVPLSVFCIADNNRSQASSASCWAYRPPGLVSAN